MNWKNFEYISPDPEGLHFRFVPPVMAIAFWELLKPYVEAVVDGACHGEFTAESVKDLVESGEITLGVAARKGRIVMVIGAEEVCYPDACAINILAMAGSGVREFMKTLLPAFARWLKTQNIDWIECSVSRAMERIHKRYGFQTMYRNMRYNVKEENVTKQI